MLTTAHVPTSMAAAVAAFDAGVRDVVILERDGDIGGILRQCIHAGFGLHKLGRELTGPEYADTYKQMVLQRGIGIYRETTVTNLSPQRMVTAQNRDGILKIQAGAIILAMGCRERSRGALNIPGMRPAGVFSAGTAQKLINCDGYQVGKRVVILGSGDIGLIMARRMTLEGAKVEAVCELMPYSGGLTRNIVLCLEDFDIPLYLSTTVCEIHGSKRLEGVTIAQVDDNRRILPQTKRFISCDTLLLSVGLIPENELTREAGIPIDPVTGGALVDQYCQTQVKGIFACGNVLHVHDLVDYVSDEAQRAGMGAAAFVKEQTADGECILTRAGNGIRYLLPQQIQQEEGKPVTLFFRVEKPFANAALVVKSGEETLARVKRSRLAPGEMEKISLGEDLLRRAVGELSVEVGVWS